MTPIREKMKYVRMKSIMKRMIEDCGPSDFILGAYMVLIHTLGYEDNLMEINRHFNELYSMVLKRKKAVDDKKSSDIHGCSVDYTYPEERKLGGGY